MIDCAKMIGITPGELSRSGMKDFCPSRMRPRPITLRGICTGIFRAAIVTAMVPAITATITMSSSTTAKMRDLVHAHQLEVCRSRSGSSR